MNAIITAVRRLCMSISNTRPGTYMTTKSWSISGVPRMTQTNVLTRYRSGLNFDMEPNVIISPSGIAPSSVRMKASPFYRKASNRSRVTVENDIMISLGMGIFPGNRKFEEGISSFLEPCSYTFLCALT